MFYVDENKMARFELSYEFPLAVHETYLKDKPRGFNDWHWHEEIQFSYVLEGEMITSCMGSEFRLGAGDGIFINSNCSHMSRPTGAQSARFMSLNIQPSLLTLFRGSVVEQKYFMPYSNDPRMQVVSFSHEMADQKVVLAEILRLFEMIREKDFAYELDAYGQLLRVWKYLLILAETQHTPQVRLEREEAHAMLRHIHEHFAENLTIDDISRAVHLSKGECSRLFQTAYGTSIIAYLIDYRVSQSIQLLIGTNLSASEIAIRCGFNSPSYFTKVFREKIGVTPLQYRKEMRRE